MAESITEGTLVQLTKQVGDYVEQDEELATIETDKIDVVVNAPHSGIIKRLLVSEGDTVTVDQTIVKLQRADSTSSESIQSSSTKTQELGSETLDKEKETVTEPLASPTKPATSTGFQNNASPPMKGSHPIQDAVQAEPRPGSKHVCGENRVCITHSIIHIRCDTFIRS
jgi:2-oxoglutarate dehydrogenase E2 component (dihydrolipoamide succinyltransferase)